MIKVKTIGMIEKNAKGNPTVKAHTDIKNGILHTVSSGLTVLPTSSGSAGNIQTKYMSIALNVGDGDNRYSDFTIKKDDFVNSYLLEAWEGQEIVFDESHITYQNSESYSSIIPNTTKLVGTDGNFKIQSDITNYSIYFMITSKLGFNGNAVTAKILIS